MLEKVRLIARNPLAAAQDDEVEMAGVMSMMRQREMVMDAQLIARLLRLVMNAQGGGSLAS
jgi:hypothetical protein